MSQQAPGPDPTAVAVGAVALRLMAGGVSRRLMDTLQRTVRQNPEGYPWQVVNQAILAEPASEPELVQRALRAQRDWILRGGRETPGRPLGVRAKSLFAKILSRLIFFALYTLAVAILLILVRQRWPEMDLYRVLGWLQEVWPGIFQPPPVQAK